MYHMVTKTTGGDRISALPEPIIHHILSFLPNKDVKVTSSLSKTWFYQISPSFPFLDFDFTWPVTYYFNFQPNKYLRYVDKTLHKFHNHNVLNLQIQRFSLTIPFTPSLPDLLDSWIPLVLQHGIQDLNLNIGNRGDRRPNWYNLPRLVLVAKSIKVVKLVGCSLLRSFPDNNHISGSTSNLLNLCLDNVVLDDVILSSIISTCPLIEDLAILSCIGIKRVQISNLRKLKTLRIVAPRLEESVKIRVLDSPKLMNLYLEEVVFDEFTSRSSSNNLLKLHLGNVVLDDIILSSIISTCPLIEVLAILCCIGIKRVQIFNLSKLKTLRISRGWIKKEGIEMVEIGAPSLQSLHIWGSVKIPILECPMLMDLDLNKVVFEEIQLQDFLLNLSYLRSLTLINLTSLTRLNMSSDTLIKLKIIGCDNLVKLKIDTPNLCSLYSRLCSIASPSKQHASYRTCDRYGDNSKVNPLAVEDFFVAMRNFLSKASDLEKFNLSLYNIQPINFEDLNKRVVQPVVNIDHLSLVLDEINDVSDVSYLDLVECVLWSCHPCTLSFIYPHKDVVMSICEVIGHRHLPCNRSRSWLHCLEEVKYVARDGSEGQLPMDGISLPWLRISYGEIKLVFKW